MSGNPFDRFEIRDPDDDGEDDLDCLLCQEDVFREEFTQAFFCLDCEPRLYVCQDCKEAFLERHDEDHQLGISYESLEDFVAYFRVEVMETCEKLVFDESYQSCIGFCQNVLRMPGLLQVALDIGLYALRIGMICHLALYEYSEAKRCAKSALSLLEQLQEAVEDANECPFVRDYVEVVSKLCHIYLKLSKFEKCLGIGRRCLDMEDRLVAAARLIHSAEDSADELTLSSSPRSPRSGISTSTRKSASLGHDMLFGRESSSSMVDLTVPDIDVLDAEASDEKLTDFVAARIDEIKYCCGKAATDLEEFDVSEDLLSSCLEVRCRRQDFVKARYALSSLLMVFFLRGQRDIGLEKYDSVLRRFPPVGERTSDVDVSFLRLKKTVDRLRDLSPHTTPDGSHIEGSVLDESDSSLDAKLISFNKQHYLAIIDNDVTTSAGKLQYAIEVAEDVIITLLEEVDLKSGSSVSGIPKGMKCAKLDEIVRKRSQLIQRMYLCCLLRKLRKEAFQWAERGRSFLFLARTMIEARKKRLEEEVEDRRTSPEPRIGRVGTPARVLGQSPTRNGMGVQMDNISIIEEAVGNPSSMINVEELVAFAKGQNCVFLYYVVVQDSHFGSGECVDVWIVNPKEDPDIVGLGADGLMRVRLDNKPLEIMRFVLELYTEINTVSSDFHVHLSRAGFRGAAASSSGSRSGTVGAQSGQHELPSQIREWRACVDKAFQTQVRRRLHSRYCAILDELHTCLIVPIQPLLPQGDVNASWRKLSTADQVLQSGKVNTAPVKAVRRKSQRGRRRRRKGRGRKRPEAALPATPVDPEVRSDWVRPIQLVVFPDEFVSFVPFAFLQSRPGVYLIDHYCVSVSQSLRLFQFHLAQVPHGRSVRHAAVKAEFGEEVCSMQVLEGSEDVEVDQTKSKSLFGLIVTDHFDEVRNTELASINQIFISAMRHIPRVMKTSDSIMLTNVNKEAMINTYRFHLTPPKIVHLANAATFTGKNLPTFQKELCPACGIQMEGTLQLDVDQFDRLASFASTELAVFSHHATISSNVTLDGFNALHGALIRSGCPTILYPMFDVSEFFSTIFFIQFYKHLFGTDIKIKKTKGQAYRHAILTSMEIFPLLRKAPLYLSPFAIAGDVLNKLSEW